MHSVIVSRALTLTIRALDRSLTEAERDERIAEVFALLTGIADD